MRRVLWVIKRLIESQFYHDRRGAAFDRLTTSFVHTGARRLKFRLEPGEHIDRYIFVEGIYERRFLRFIREVFGGSAMALDIGANIGNHTVYLADTFAGIHCFEPNPVALERLRDNLALNHLRNVEVHPFGLSDRDAKLPFRPDIDGNLGASGFVQPGQLADADVTMLQVRRGDDVIEGLGIDRLDFIKVDVEGHEPAVLEGLPETIRRYRPVIAFEFHAQDASVGDWDRIVAQLPEYVFVEAQHAPADASLWRKMRWNYRHVGRPELRRFVLPELRTYANILAFPSEEALAGVARQYL